MAEGSLALLAWEEGAPLRGPAREDAVLRCYGCVPSRLLGVRAAAMVALRIARFGPSLRLSELCPNCGEPLEATLDLSALADALPPALDAEDAEVATAAGTTWLRRPTLDDLAAIAAFEETAAATEALRGRLFGAGLGGEEGEAVLEALDPWADLTIALECSACGHAFERFLDIGAILWGDVEAEAQALLDDIARLARAFGWSEAALLAMAPARRRAYLERLE